MATYKQIQKYVEAKSGFTPKTCWIAHVKEMAGLEMHKAWNRTGKVRKITCPPEKVEAMMDAFRHFEMV